jgi:hypothetical protein
MRRDYPPPDNPCIYQAVPEPESGPVVPLFPQPPDSSGHNSQKCGIRAGIIRQSPAGMGEVVFSNVTQVEEEEYTIPAKGDSDRR